MSNDNSGLRLTLQVLLPIVLIAGGVFGAWYLNHNKPKPTVVTPVNEGPLVRLVRVRSEPVRLDVVARGTVEPLRTVELAAEVSGRIVATSPAMRAGGTFTPNDVLAQLDPTDFRLAITSQQAAVARAELNLAREEAEAEAALRAWQKLEGDRPADALVRREPQLEDARLALAAAKAQLERAQVDLERTKVMLPFAGRVRSVAADVGQTVQRGQRLATVIDTSATEVRLPIALDDLAFVDLPLDAATDQGAEVELHAEFAGRPCVWHGHVVRTEGEIDRQTRQLTVVARVDGDGDGDQPPLLVGMFVEARISGRTFDDVVVVPRAALDGSDRIWVAEARCSGVRRAMVLGSTVWVPTFGALLRERRVTVLRAERDRVLLSGGLASGDLVSISNLDAPVDGMTVRVGDIRDAIAEEK